MTDARTTWEKLADEYVRKVAKALSGVDHPRKEEVLEDLRAHLRQRYDELAPEEGTPARLAALIEEMGPPEDYAELLAPDARRVGPPFPWRKVWHVGRWVLLAIGVLVLVVTAVWPTYVLLELTPGALQAVIVVALVWRYRTSRDSGLLWLIAALVLLPIVTLPLPLLVKAQVDNISAAPDRVWLWPFTRAARGTITTGQALMLWSLLWNVVRCGLILVGLLKLRLTPRTDRTDGQMEHEQEQENDRGA